jgi:signal transduction histidine kinase
MINAIQACAAGSTVRLSAGLTEGGRAFELKVVDNGPGMTQQVWRRATELFYTTKRNGSGIGLALCKRAAEEAGGRFEIESVPGFGTAVTLKVPVH